MKVDYTQLTNKDKNHAGEIKTTAGVQLSSISETNEDRTVIITTTVEDGSEKISEVTYLN